MARPGSLTNLIRSKQLGLDVNSQVTENHFFEQQEIREAIEETIKEECREEFHKTIGSQKRAKTIKLLDVFRKPFLKEPSTNPDNYKGISIDKHA